MFKFDQYVMFARRCCSHRLGAKIYILKGALITVMSNVKWTHEICRPPKAIADRQKRSFTILSIFLPAMLDCSCPVLFVRVYLGNGS